MTRLTFRSATSAAAPLVAAWDAEPHVRAAVSEDGSAGFAADWPEESADGRLACDVVGEGERPIGFPSLIADVLERHAVRLRGLDIIIGGRGALGRGLGTEMMTWRSAAASPTPRSRRSRSTL